MTPPPEAAMTIIRGDVRNATFRPKVTVRGTEPFDLGGSTFLLTIRDVLGATLVTKAGVVADGTVTFPLTLEEKASLPLGSICRYSVVRTLGDQDEVWWVGAVNVKGG